MPRSGPKSKSLALRFWAKVEITPTCWIWKGAITTNGYGELYLAAKKRPESAHRIAYELMIGPLPEEREIDHLCHNVDTSCAGGHGCPHRRCVNPEHLEPVTRRVNSLRGRLPALNTKRGADQSICKHGHPFSPDNTYTYTNRRGFKQRVCRECARRRDRQHYERTKHGVSNGRSAQIN